MSYTNVQGWPAYRQATSRMTSMYEHRGPEALSNDAIESMQLENFYHLGILLFLSSSPYLSCFIFMN